MIATENEARRWLGDLPEYDPQTDQRLTQLVELLAEENQRQNLIARSTLDEVWRRHIVDSAQLLTHVPRGTSSWLDLGSGAGFPGVIAAIFRPETSVTLVESRALRAQWLEHLRATLSLGNVSVFAHKLERLPTREVAVISARAFAPLARLVTLSARFSTAATLWLLPKGRAAADELRDLRGWHHMFHVEQSLTDPTAGIIVGQLIGRKEMRG